jgi:hypothetical protein
LNTVLVDVAVTAATLSAPIVAQARSVARRAS